MREPRAERHAEKLLQHEVEHERQVRVVEGYLPRRRVERAGLERVEPQDPRFTRPRGLGQP